MPKPVPEAVCGLFFNGDKVLAVNRFPKSGIANDWNFPGGKLNPNESVGEALVRETYEETGLVAYGGESRTVFVRYCGEDGAKFVAYVTYGRIITGELRGSAEGDAQWVEWSKILSPHCTFYDFNSELYKYLQDAEPDLLVATK